MKAIRISLLAIVMLTGCSQTPNQGRDIGQGVQNADMQAQRSGKQTPRGANSIQSGSINNKADHLKSIARSVPQVSEAYCLVIGNLAIVAIDVPPDINGSRVDVIKQSVAEALRNDDPHGADALVTADLDVKQNILNISSKLQKGQPISAFSNELGDILGRLIPQLPQSSNQDETRNQLPNTR